MDLGARGSSMLTTLEGLLNVAGRPERLGTSSFNNEERFMDLGAKGCSSMTNDEVLLDAGGRAERLATSS
jgi:hypothetical protein